MLCAVYHGPRKIRVEERPEPIIEPGGMLIRVLACGVCSTDVKTLLRGHPLIKPPAVLGHEVAGVVTRLGESTKGFKVGDYVSVSPYISCGSCYYCLRGEETLCENLFKVRIEPGGFSEYISVPRKIVEKGCVKINGIEPEYACLTEPVACCIHSLAKSNIGQGDSLVIIGSGIMGLIHLQLAKRLKTSKIIVVDLREDRLKVALNLGADIAVNPSTEDPVGVVLSHTGGRGADRVVVATGNPEAIMLGMKIARKGGITVLFGGCEAGTTIKVDPNLIHYKEKTITGSFGFTPKNFREAAELLKSKSIDFSGLIKPGFKLSDLPKAAGMMKRGEIFKAVISP